MSTVAVRLVASLVLVAAGLAPASALAEPVAARVGPARADDSIAITTTRAVAWGTPYPGLDGVPEDFVYRPHFDVVTTAVCPSGSTAIVEFSPVGAHQLPISEQFTCTGSAQSVLIHPACGSEPVLSQVTATLMLLDGESWTSVASTERTVQVTDVRTSWASLTAPAEVLEGRRMELTSTLQLFTQGAWTPLSTRVEVQFDGSTVGEVETGDDGALRFTTSPLTQSGAWRLAWTTGGRDWSSYDVPVAVRHLPGAPGLWAGTVTGTTADLHWSAPESDVAITGYRFGWTSSNGKPVPSWHGDWPADAPNPLTMTNLNPGTTYQMWVRALTALGAGPRTAVSVTTVGQPVFVAPSAPRSLTAQPGRRRVVLHWAAPASDGGARITRYRVRMSHHGRHEVLTVAGRARGHRFSGLRAGTRYTFVVRARNPVGWGPWSRAVAARPR